MTAGHTIESARLKLISLPVEVLVALETGDQSQAEMAAGFHILEEVFVLDLPQA